MKIRLIRKAIVGDCTLGDIFVDGVWEGFTIEDIVRDGGKVAGQTAIPAGTYPIKFREVVSGKTISYRERYPWFKWHLWLQDVPGFEYVYIHIGNSAKDTEGCILVGSTQEFGKNFVGMSTPRFKEFYTKVSAALEAGEDVSISVEQVW